MVAYVQRPRWSVKDYFELESFSPVRHEFIDGYVYAMAGGSTAHGLISANVIALLRPLLRGGPCRVFSSDVKVQVSSSRYVYPDASISCDGRDRASSQMKEMSSVGKFRHGLPRGFVFAIRVLTFSQSEGESNGRLWYFGAGPPYQLIGRHQIGLSRLRSLSGEKRASRGHPKMVVHDP